MISIQNLNKYYGKLHVLRDINLELNNGECVAFIGPNGCGKTTLMKCILGLVLQLQEFLFLDDRRKNPCVRKISPNTA